MVLTNHRGHGGSRQRQVEDLSVGLSVVSFAQQPGRCRGKTRCFRCNQEGHVAKDCTAIIEGSESKRGGSDDNDSVGSGSGKVAWNFSQVERGVKWQKAMDDDSLHFQLTGVQLSQPVRCEQDSPTTEFHPYLRRSVLEDVCICNNGIFEIPTSRSSAPSTKCQHCHNF